MPYQDDDDARRKGKQPLIEVHDEQDEAVAAARITTTTPPPSDPISCSTSGNEGLDVGTSSSSRAPPKFQEGYHFEPRDDELIRYYLDAKLSGRELPLDVFNDVQLYDHNPKELVETYKEWGENRWYFFTPRERKYLKGSRPNRTTNDGYWKATGSDKIINYKGSVIGSRKTLVYYEGKSKEGGKTDWVMYEYTKPKKSMKLNDWVLCSVQMTRGALSKQNRKRKLQQVHGESSNPSPQSPNDDLMIEFTEGLNLHQVAANEQLQHSSTPDQLMLHSSTSIANQPFMVNGYGFHEVATNGQFQHSSTPDQLMLHSSTSIANQPFMVNGYGFHEVATNGQFQHSSTPDQLMLHSSTSIANQPFMVNGYGFHEVATNEQFQHSSTPDQLMLHSSTSIANHPFTVNGDDFYPQFAHHQQTSSMECQVMNNGGELDSAVVPYIQMPHSFMEAGTTNGNELHRVDPDQDMSHSLMPPANYTVMCNGDGIDGAAPNPQMTDSWIPPTGYPFMGSGHEFHGVVPNERMSCMESGINNGSGFSELAPSEQMPHSCFSPTNFLFMNNGDDWFDGLTVDQQISYMGVGINNGAGFYDAATHQNMAYTSTPPVNRPPLDDGSLEGDHAEAAEQYPLEHDQIS